MYDGLPEFVDSTGRGTLLAAYCSYKDQLMSAITAKSGILTVYFDADISGHSKFTSHTLTYANKYWVQINARDMAV